MARLFFNLIICCACFIVTSCNSEVTIGGTAEKCKELHLYSFKNGEIALLQSVEIEKETGLFEFVQQLPYEGLYLMGSNNKALYPLYLKGGEKIEAEYKDNRLSLSGALSDENEALFKWEEGANDVKIDAFLYNWLPGENSVESGKFFEELQKLAEHKSAMLKELDGKKGDFYNWLRNKIVTDTDFYALNYLRAKGSEIPDTLALPEYYNTMNADEVFQNPEIVKLPYAGKMLESYVWYKNREKEQVKGEPQYHIESLESKELQQEYLLSIASGLKSYDDYSRIVGLVGENFFTGTYADRLAKIEEFLSWSKPGVKAPDFKAMAPDSSWMSLSDYNGKVVVVDVWATWCEPCRRMMPLFHQLQKKFEGENVVFLSVCVGVWIEIDKWLELSKEFHIEKNNFFVSGWDSDFVIEYHISGVPRYMVFDEQGKIVSVFAPNPTTPKLEEMIKKTLE